MDTLLNFPISILIGALFAYLLAGLVKGTIGIGLPTAGISLTAQLTDARTAIALVILPMLVTNVWQVWRTRQYAKRTLQFWPLAASMVVSISVFSVAAPAVPAHWVTLFLGVTVLVFSLVSLWREVPSVSPTLDKPVQVIAGCLAGVMGGITGVWAPPMIIYMSAARVDKTTFVAVIGVLLMLGSAVLAVSYSSNGLFTSNHAIISLLLVVPSLIGFSIGERVRHRLNEDRFKRLVLLFFFIMGINLIRKAIF